MSVERIDFNGNIINIPKKYLESIDITSDTSLSIVDSSGKVYKFGVEKVIVDNYLSTSSSNPVANNVVAQRFNSLSTTINTEVENIKNVNIPEAIKNTIDSELNIEVQKNFRTIGLLGRTEITQEQVNYPIESFSFENISTDYIFEINSNGYYESNNKGKDNTYCLCKLNFVISEPTNIDFEVINSGESNYDFGIFSQIDQTLTSSYTEDTSSILVYKSYKGASSTTPVVLTYTDVSAGEHFITVKFRKDGSSSSGNDSLQFKMTSNVSGVITTSQIIINKLTTNDEDELLFNGEVIGAVQPSSETQLGGVRMWINKDGYLEITTEPFTATEDSE